MEDIYCKNPRFQTKELIFRKVSKNDLEELLSIYSNKNCVVHFNLDNLENIKYFCLNIDEMKSLFEFWNFAYKSRWFTRLCIINRKENVIIGCAEFLLRHSIDSFDNSVVIRIDLKEEYENYTFFSLVLKEMLIKKNEYFGHRKTIVKAKEDEIHRIKALLDNGFVLSKRKLIGDRGQTYNSYYILNEYNY